MEDAALKIFIFISLFISFSTAIIVAAHDDDEDKCSYATCGREDTGAQFPFTLEGHQDRSCGYPGFHLSCDKSNGTVLDLGASGKFMVRFIDYPSQEIQIYDQDDCLPKRLMNFDLTGTPFKSYYQQYINFYNCSVNFSSVFFDPIGCLSTPNYTVYVGAASFGIRETFHFGCELLGTAMVPLWEIYDQLGYIAEIDINADIHLRWDSPNCVECVGRGGTCRFKNRAMNEIGCFNVPRHGLSRSAKYVLGIGLGGPGLLFVLLMVCCVSGRFKSLNHGNNLRHTELSSSVLPHPPMFIVGLEEAVIQSCPKIVLGDSRRLAKPEDNICAICLSEYRAKETLKIIPYCKHCFHAVCIDQWLRRNITCPLCRNAPMPMQILAPMPVPMPPPPPPESHPM